MPSTLKDVAAAAGVSSATASLVLNGGAPRGRVRPEVADRVREAAASLNYRRNALAQAIRTGSSETVAFALDARASGEGWDQHAQLARGYWGAILGGLECALRLRSWSTLVTAGDQAADGLQRAAQAALDRRCDGIVVAGALAADAPVAAMRRLAPEVPLVAIGDGGPLQGESCRLRSDDEAGFAAAAAHLADLGHRRVAWLAPGHAHFAASVLRRLTGLRAGGQLDVIPLRYDPLPDAKRVGRSIEEVVIQGGRRSIHAALEQASRDWTAVVAFNDLIALGAIAALQERGLRIPEDVAVIGCDNHAAVYAHPALSSVDLGHHEAGRLAGELLHQRIVDGRSLPTERRLDASLSIRASTVRAA